MVLHLLSPISVAVTTFLMAALKAFATAVHKEAAEGRSEPVVQAAPKTPQTILQDSGLNPLVHTFPCCPRCYTMYTANTVPQTCTAPHLTNGPNPRQRRNLLGPDKNPVFNYYHQDFQNWLARLCARCDLAPYLEPDAIKQSTDGIMRDIWDGPCLRDFKGPDGLPFVRPDVGEGHLVFSLNYDDTNPLNSKAAGKKCAIGPMYLVCLNLPEAIRYDEENIYMPGIVPGPNAASAELNSILQRVVDEFLVAWEPGIFVSEMPLHPEGCLTRCAVIPVVCDLVGACKLCGLPLHSHTYWCHLCPNTRDDESLSTAGPRHSWADHSYYAQLWRDAPSKAEQG